MFQAMNHAVCVEVSLLFTMAGGPVEFVQVD